MVVSAKEKNKADGENRRGFLKGLGTAGVAMAIAGILPTEILAADEKQGLLQVPNVASLLSLQVDKLAEGTLVMVGGYYKEGDGGAKLMRWVPASLRYDNRGTVHNPRNSNEEAGRFEIVHDGIGDFRWFGIFDETKAADAAFQSLLDDGSISTIRAHSDLLFLSRERRERSRITLDFNNYTVYTYGAQGDNNAGGATFWFVGKNKGNRDKVTLTEDLPEYSELYPVSDSSSFAIGQWYTLQSDRVPDGGVAERELEKLCKVIEVVDKNHVRFDYTLGWPLKAGRNISYQQVQPVHDVCIKNMHFVGNGRPTTTDAKTGANPISFELAVRCDVYNCHATQTFWSMVFRRFNSYYTTEHCSLRNPVEIQVGGTGYLTQQIACCYGITRDCVASMMRHLTDFTGSAYCEVINCHAIGDNMGPFGTHGQYEHDLTFIGNSGLIGLTNTMTNWGRSAKNVLIKNHTGAAVLVQNFVTNVTLENIHTFQEKGMVYAGMIKANVDGLVIKNCHADTMLLLSQYCRRGERPTVISDSTFRMLKGEPLGRLGAHLYNNTPAKDGKPIWSSVTFRNCTFEGMDDNPYLGIGEVFFERCHLIGAGKEAAPFALSTAKTKFVDCTFTDMALAIEGKDQAQTLEILKAKVEGENANNFIQWKNIKFPATIEMRGVRYEAKNPSFFVLEDEAKINRLLMADCHFESGKASFAEKHFSSDSVVFITQSFGANGFSLGSLPRENNRIQYTKGIKYI